VCACVRAHIHTHAHIHAHIHTYIHTDAHLDGEAKKDRVSLPKAFFTPHQVPRRVLVAASNGSQAGRQTGKQPAHAVAYSMPAVRSSNSDTSSSSSSSKKSRKEQFSQSSPEGKNSENETRVCLSLESSRVGSTPWLTGWEAVNQTNELTKEKKTLPLNSPLAFQRTRHRDCLRACWQTFSP
jgi:hypothetical protein